MFRFNAKNGFYFDIKLSTASYTMDYNDGLFYGQQYYELFYGDLDGYLAANNYAPYNPLLGPEQNNVTAYAVWFNEQIEKGSKEGEKGRLAKTNSGNGAELIKFCDELKLLTEIYSLSQ